MNTSNDRQAGERDDAALIEQCVRGDRSAYGELVRRHQDRLFNTMARLLGNAEDAAEVVQDAFLNAFVSLQSFKGDSRFFTWLYRIAVNSAMSMRRKQRVPLLADAQPGEALLAEPADDSDSNRPEWSLERSEECARLQAALDRLTPEHRLVMILKEIEGRKYDEIAEITGVPIGTVRSRLHRARLELRQCLIESLAPDERP